MEEDLKKIKIGPESPQLGLPSPILPSLSDGGVSSDAGEDDSITMEDLDSVAGTSVSSMPLSISVASVPRPPPPQTPCVGAVPEAVSRPPVPDGSDDDATNASDLDSNAFYWHASPPVIQREYSVALDRALEKKSAKLSHLLNELHIADEAVRVAIKELVTTDEKASRILKRMHEGMARASRPTTTTTNTTTTTTKPAPGGTTAAEIALAKFVDSVQATVVSGNIHQLATAAGRVGYGYFWRDEKLWTYPVAASSGCLVDVEICKMQALQGFLEPQAGSYHAAYTALRKQLRDVVTSGDYQLPPPAVVKQEHRGEPSPPPVFEAQTPTQWLRAQLQMDLGAGSPRFNVRAFLKDSKLGPMEHEPQYFVDLGRATSFLAAFRKFVVPRERDMAQVGRNFLFDLKKSDDILARFLESDASDRMLLMHKLSVLLAKEAVLLRVWVNHHLPNIAMWLCVVETMQFGGERKLVSPFFPPTGRKALMHQLTALGVFDQETMGLVRVFDPEGGSDDDEGDDEGDASLGEEAQEFDADHHHAADDDLRFSKMFARLFSSRDHPKSMRKGPA